VRQKAPPATRFERSEGLPERLGTYATVGRIGRSAAGEIFEASDTGLDRRVWIHRRDPGAPPLAPERRSLESATRLRWLDGFEENGCRHEVFEAPGGARLLDCCASEGRLAWPTAHGMLSTLAAEMDRDPPARISLDQLWIDRSWSLRILDEPLGENVSPQRGPMELLVLAAHTSLGASPGSAAALPPDLPEHAEPTARRLLGLGQPFATIADARRSLSETADRPQGLTWRIRGLQMLLGSGPWIVFCGISLFSTRLLVRPQALEMRKAQVALQELRSGRQMTAADLSKEGAAPTGPEIDADGMRDRAILVAELQTRLQGSGMGAVLKLTDEEKALVAKTKAESGRFTAEEVDAARARVESQRLPGVELEKERSVQMFERMHLVLPFGFTLSWAALAVLCAFVLRGGLSLRVVSLAVRDAQGRRAGRLRCAWRACLCAAPLVAIYVVPLVLMATEHIAWATVCLIAAILVHALLIATSLRSPARGWQDRIAGTRLVPR